MATVERIVSGGQTGADRAALDVAIALGLPHGGWCPRGRKAEDGRIPERYPMTETSSGEYHVRTDRNVRDSDGTVVVTVGDATGGSALTLDYTARRKRPALHLDLAAVSADAAAAKLNAWLAEHAIATLNVAGPREGTTPGIYDRTRALLEAALGSGR
jgi:hypothetical protein